MFGSPSVRSIFSMIRAAARVALVVDADEHLAQALERVLGAVVLGEPALEGARRRSPRCPARARASRGRSTSRAGPSSAMVQSRTSLSIRSGALMPSHMPVIPPSERPAKCACSISRWSSRSSTSRPTSSIEYGPCGRVAAAVAARVVADQPEVLRASGFDLRVPHLAASRRASWRARAAGRPSAR